MSVASLRPLAPVNISRVLQGAAVFDFRRHSSHQSFVDANNISLEAEELFGLLETRGVPYLLVGGLAMLTHVRGRNTDDVALIIGVAEQRRLEPEVVLVDPPGKGSPFAVGQYKQLCVDYLDARAPIFRRVLERHGERRRFSFGSGSGRELPVATAAGLMLLKLHALPSVTRQMDWERVNAYENDVLMLWMADEQLAPETMLGELRPFMDEAGLYSLEREVLPAIAQRRERMLATAARLRTFPPLAQE